MTGSWKIWRAPLMITGPGAPALAANDAPFTEKWAPGECGADDKVGAVNQATAAIVLKAAKLVKQGKVYHRDAPAFGSRGWRMIIPNLPTDAPSARRNWSTLTSF